jgi:hypothetical protein
MEVGEVTLRAAVGEALAIQRIQGAAPVSNTETPEIVDLGLHADLVMVLELNRCTVALETVVLVFRNLE